jgi:hypothetical protein
MCNHVLSFFLFFSIYHRFPADFDDDIELVHHVLAMRYGQDVPRDLQLPRERKFGFHFLEDFRDVEEGDRRDILMKLIVGAIVVPTTNSSSEESNNCLIRSDDEGYVTILKKDCRLAEVLWAIYHPDEVDAMPNDLPRPICGEEYCVRLDHLRMMGHHERHVRAFCQALVACFCVRSANSSIPCILKGMFN